MAKYETKKSFSTHFFSGRILSDFPEYVVAILEVKQSAANANAKAGLISVEHAAQISEIAENLKNTLTKDRAAKVEPYQGGGGIATHRSVIEAFLKMGADAKAINLNQSTSDVCGSAIQISLWRISQTLIDQVERSAVLLSQKAKEFEPIKTLARTCMQDASDIGVGARFAGFACRMQQRLHYLKEARQDLLHVRLGGTVIGELHHADENYRRFVLEEAKLVTKVPLVASTNFVAHSQHPAVLQNFSMQMKCSAEELLRLMKDLRMLSSGPMGGFGELEVPKLMSGSSFFKEKANPTLLETVMQACMLVIGRCRSVDAGVEHAEIDLNVFEQMMGLCIYESIHYLTRAHEKLNLYCFEGIKVNKQRCAELEKFTRS